jgi:uncharacterized phage-associated protein
MQHQFTSQQLDKIGNTIVYLSNGVGNLSKTKILKLLFLVEESSFKLFGYPFFGVDFQIWKFGPVIKDVYIDLSEESPVLLHKFIEKEFDYFKSISLFNDDEFSDNDIYLMDKIIAFAKNKSATALVEYTHDENSLWKKSAIKHGVLEDLLSQRLNSTDKNIDFGLLFEENEFMRERLNNSIENMQFIYSLKK